MAKFYKRLVWVQLGLLILLFGIPKLIAEDRYVRDALQPYSIEYDVIADGDKLGTASRQLEQLSNGQWQIAMQSQIRYYLLKDERQETSRFEVIDDQIFPVQYRRIADSSFKDSSLIQQFDWANQHETGSYKKDKWDIELPDGALDQLTQLLMIRRQLLSQSPLEPITISYRGSIRTQNFKVVGEETLDLAMGKIKTAKIQLDEKGGKRQTNFWLALEKISYQCKFSASKKAKKKQG